MTHLRRRVIIIGAGFGGLYAAQTLRNTLVDVLLIDRHNFHTFTPLLYQVATSGLDPSGIAYPIRSIFRRAKNVQFLLGKVQSIDYANHQVVVQTDTKIVHENYDYLIVAAGSITNTFNIDGLEQFSFGLKDLSDAVVLRNHILKLFERAAWATDADKKRALTTLVVVGGGPTGLETAGALFELYNNVLRQEYAELEAMKTRVILVEAMDHLLDPYPTNLRELALSQLRSLGVEVMLGEQVEGAAKDHVRLKSGIIIPTYTLVWAAGVKASNVAQMLGVSLQRGGRVPIHPSTEVIGHEDIYAVGDIAYLEDRDGKPYPMLIPVAKQQGILAANNILRRIKGWEQQSFKYIDRGIMATIGRSRAVAWLFYRITLTGYLAWVAWLTLHLIWLMGFRNRISVFVNWVWNYLTYDRSVRIILEHKPYAPDQEPENEKPVIPQA